MSLGPLYVLLGEVSVQFLCHFVIGLLVFLIWNHVSSLYILEIKPLCKVSLANMFSHTVGSLSILLMFSLAVQKPFCLMHSHVFIFSFLSFVIGDILVKILLHGMSEIFLPVFSSRTFMVSWPIFKSFIHLEFILVYGVSWWFSFIFFFCMYLSRSANTIYWRRYFYSLFRLPLSDINWPLRHGFISGFSILFHWSICLFLCQYQTVLNTVAL